MAIISLAVLLLVVVTAALSRHKKSATRDLKLMGANGLVETTLGPEGSVIINGELWRARSNGGVVVSPKTHVRVVDFQGHLLLVEESSNKPQLSNISQL